MPVALLGLKLRCQLGCLPGCILLLWLAVELHTPQPGPWLQLRQQPEGCLGCAAWAALLLPG